MENMTQEAKEKAMFGLTVAELETRYNEENDINAYVMGLVSDAQESIRCNFPKLATMSLNQVKWFMCRMQEGN